jgi:hypothetical protein
VISSKTSLASASVAGRRVSRDVANTRSGSEARTKDTDPYCRDVAPPWPKWCGIYGHDAAPDERRPSPTSTLRMPSRRAGVVVVGWSVHRAIARSERSSTVPASASVSSTEPAAIMAVVVTSPTQRARLAKVFGDFWYGGAGPSHGEIDDAFAVAGVEAEPGSKRDRVSDAVQRARDDQLRTLIEQLVDLLRLHELPGADQATLTRLRSAMRPFGLELDETFEVHQPTLPRFDHVPDEPALREHIDRIQRAIRDGDDAQLLGSTKELLETTAKVVLRAAGKNTPTKFPALLTAAFEALHLHPKATPSTGTPLEKPVREILGGALQVTLGIDELRNSHGTGHGRVAAARLSRRHARLAAGAGVTIATLLLDTLDDPEAPWRKSPMS